MDWATVSGPGKAGPVRNEAEANSQQDFITGGTTRCPSACNCLTLRWTLGCCHIRRFMLGKKIAGRS